MKENEINACNAFIKILQKIKGVEYYIESWPEKENRNTQDVEVILAPKDKNGQSPKIAVEHTVVEAHEEQIAYVNQLYGIEKEIDQRCQGKLPIDSCFGLVAPPSLIVGMNKKNRGQFVEEISGWIPDVAKSLTTDQQSSRLYNEHEVSLWCVGSGSKLNGTVRMVSKRPEEAEKERQGRFRRAVEEKLPKLIKYKKKGYTTALLLEDVSFSHALPKDNWKDLIPNQYHSEFQLKIDYVVIFVSNEKKMIVGNVWKEESQLYKEILDNRRFSLRH
ncbi:MAG: hypothetical protein ACYSSI_03950 [Planctomycetota bacterium]